MVKIIKEGQNKFFATCTKCGCQFEYELEDVVEYLGDSVGCPYCGTKYYHRIKDNYYGVGTTLLNNGVEENERVNKENARWLTGIDNDFYCSKCGTYAEYFYRGSTRYQSLTNYCGHCGAKMENNEDSEIKCSEKENSWSEVENYEIN